MDMVHCERQAKLALEESKGGMQLIHGELIMQSYFENLAAEVQEILQVAHEPPCIPECDAHTSQQSKCRQPHDLSVVRWYDDHEDTCCNVSLLWQALLMLGWVFLPAGMGSMLKTWQMVTACRNVGWCIWRA